MKQEILKSDDGETSSWVYDHDHCVVQSSNPKVISRINRWSFAEPFMVWITSRTKSFKIKKKKWKWALQGLNIPLPPKNKKRVLQGKTFGSRNLKNNTWETSKKDKALTREVYPIKDTPTLPGTPREPN